MPSEASDFCAPVSKRVNGRQGEDRIRRTDAGLSCVIFATLQNSFKTVTVQDKFSNSMLRIYYNRRGYNRQG